MFLQINQSSFALWEPEWNTGVIIVFLKAYISKFSDLSTMVMALVESFQDTIKPIFFSCSDNKEQLFISALLWEGKLQRVAVKDAKRWWRSELQKKIGCSRKLDEVETEMRNVFQSIFCIGVFEAAFLQTNGFKTKHRKVFDQRLLARNITSRRVQFVKKCFSYRINFLGKTCLKTVSHDAYQNAVYTAIKFVTRQTWKV